MILRGCARGQRASIWTWRDPAAYGLMLPDISETDHNLARGSYRTIHRFVDVLSAMALAVEVKDHRLVVDAARFRKAVQSKPGVPRYGRVLAKLRDHGFVVSGLDGDAIARSAVSVTAECPDDPRRTDTLKANFACWERVDRFRNKDNPKRGEWIKLPPQGFHHLQRKARRADHRARVFGAWHTHIQAVAEAQKHRRLRRTDHLAARAYPSADDGRQLPELRLSGGHGRAPQIQAALDAGRNRAYWLRVLVFLLRRLSGGSGAGLLRAA